MSQDHTNVGSSNLNVISGIDTQTMIVQNSNFHFAIPQQAYINPSKKVLSQIQPTLTNSSFFNSSNNFIDFNIPTNSHIDKIEDIYLEVELSNSSTTVACVLATVPYMAINRVEIRLSDVIVETITPTQLYLAEAVYKGDLAHMQTNAVNTAIDPITFDLSTSYNTIPISGSITYRLSLVSFLTRAKLYLSTFSQKLTLRIYSNTLNISSGSLSTVTLTNFVLYVQHQMVSSPTVLNKLKSTKLQYRYLDVVLEEALVNLTSGSKTSYVTQNYDSSMLCSHVFIVFRSSNLNLDFQNVASSIYFEDNLGNMIEPIQYTNNHLLQVTYPHAFKNLLSQQTNKSVYTLLLGAQHPLSTVNDGVVSGYVRMSRNMKLNIVSNTSSTVTMSIYAYVYKLCTVNAGQLTFN